MRNLFWDEVCISLKHMDNLPIQCWISQIEIVECAFQLGFIMCKIYNFEAANKISQVCAEPNLHSAQSGGARGNFLET